MQEFAASAAALLRLDILEQHIPNSEALLLYCSGALGLLCCFFGWKLRKLWFTAVCLLFGCFVGNLLYSRELIEINLAVGISLLAAVLFLFTRRLAAPELTFCIAFYLLTVPLEIPVSAAVLPCLALAIAALFLGRWVVTASTAVFGAFAVVNLLPRLPVLQQMKGPFLSLLTPAHREYFIALGILALLGFLCQFGFGSSDPLVRFKKK